MSLEDIKYVDIHTYDNSYIGGMEAAFKDGATNEATSMQCVVEQLLSAGRKELLIDILQAIRDDTDCDYFVVHQNAELESLNAYIERLTENNHYQNPYPCGAAGEYYTSLFDSVESDAQALALINDNLGVLRAVRACWRMRGEFLSGLFSLGDKSLENICKHSEVEVQALIELLETHLTFIFDSETKTGNEPAPF